MDAKTAAAIENLKQNKRLAEGIMQSADGQKLMNMLTGGDGGAALNRAAQSAAHGDTRELAQMIQTLMKNKDAAAIMNRLGNSAKR